MNAPRSKRIEINGWVVLDKPVGMTSTQAVAQLKRIFNAKKAGHAGTLDPLASGVLPVAFGEATKTVPFVQDGEKTYRFTIAWGAETDFGRRGWNGHRALRASPRSCGNSRRAARIHRADHAAPADLFGDQGRGRARL